MFCLFLLVRSRQFVLLQAPKVALKYLRGYPKKQRITPKTPSEKVPSCQQRPCGQNLLPGTGHGRAQPAERGCGRAQPGTAEHSRAQPSTAEPKSNSLDHRCPFWLVWLKSRGPWFTWWFNLLPGPSMNEIRTPMVLALCPEDF